MTTSESDQHSAPDVPTGDQPGADADVNGYRSSNGVQNGSRSSSSEKESGIEGSVRSLSVDQNASDKQETPAPQPVVKKFTGRWPFCFFNISDKKYNMQL